MTQRLRELAQEGARNLHLTALKLGGSRHWGHYFECTHPDCALVRAAVEPAPPQEYHSGSTHPGRSALASRLSTAITAILNAEPRGVTEDVLADLYAIEHELRAEGRSEGAAPREQFCSCSVPDFVGYAGEPENWRCLLCGLYPSPDAQIHVPLMKRRTVTASDPPAPTTTESQ